MKQFTKIICLLFCSLCCLSSLHAQSVGGVTSGAAAYCSATNAGFVTVSGYTGSIINWQSSTDGGLTWTAIANTTANQSYVNLAQTTCYQAVVQNGAFPPDTSTMVCITIYPPSVGGTLSGGGTFCGGTGPGSITLSGYTGNILYWQFSIDGGATWTTISNTTPVENYLNITVNTLYSVVVQSAPACLADTSTQVSFVVDPSTVAGTIASSASVCFGTNLDTLILSGSVGSVLGWISSTDGGLTWTPIANTTDSLIYSGLTTTTMYAAIVQSGSCAMDTATAVTVSVFAPFAVSAGNDTSIMLGQSLILNGSGTGIPNWTPAGTLNNPAIFGPTATPVSTTTYTLFVTDINGCVNSDDVIVTIIQPIFNGVVSNLFTPNGDGANDFWYIENILNFPDNEVFVYNIYGNEVYTMKAYKNDWAGTYNGADLPDGTYFYVIRFDKSSRIVKGSVDILRK